MCIFVSFVEPAKYIAHFHNWANARFWAIVDARSFVKMKPFDNALSMTEHIDCNLVVMVGESGCLAVLLENEL